MTSNSLIPMDESSTVDMDELLRRDPTLLKIIAAREDTSELVLAYLACSQNEGVRKAVADNPHTPKDVLTALASDDKYAVYCAVASNPNTPDQVLKRLIERNGGSALLALKNPSLSLENVLYHLLDSVDDREKTAIGLNKKFSKLFATALEMDKAYFVDATDSNITASDFDSEDDTVEARWS